MANRPKYELYIDENAQVGTNPILTFFSKNDFVKIHDYYYTYIFDFFMSFDYFTKFKFDFI